MDGKLNIKALILKLLSKWHYFLISLLIVLPLAYLYTKYTDSIYLIRASILINSGVKPGMDTQKFLKGMELLTSHTEIEDEIGILQSDNLVENTVHKLDFGVSYFEKRNFKTYEYYGNSFPFKIELDSTANQVVGIPMFVERLSDSTFILTAEGKDVNTYNFYTNQGTAHEGDLALDRQFSTSKPVVNDVMSFKIKFKDDYIPTDGESRYYFVINDLSGITSDYREKLVIKPISKESNLVEINLKSKVPGKDVKFLNKLLDVYLTNELNKKNMLGVKTIKFIDDQLSGVSDELRQVESSLESFRSTNNILDINATAENLTKNLNSLETDKDNLELKLKYYKYIAGALAKNDLKNIGTPSTFGLEDQLLNNLLMELSRLNQERIGLDYSTKEGNPVAQVIDLKIANHKKTLIDNVNNFIEATSVALSDLNMKISDVKRTIQGLPRSEREMVSIQRRFNFNDNVYNYLLEKKAEAGIAIASNTVEKTVIDRAKPVGSGPVFPDRNMILLIAGVIGIFLGIGAVILHDVINDNIITTEDVEKNTRIPFIGTIAHGTKRERSPAVVASAKSALGESFRSLRVNLQYLTLGNENNVIGITSSIESEGKTFCSANLAVTMAQSGRRTLLIDADLRKPRVANFFQLKNEKGLSSYLIGNCHAREIINATSIKGLDVITAGPIPPNPLDLIALPRMDELINSLKLVYNTIIIDTSPIGYVSEYIILMKHTNANIYVVRSNYTNRYHLEKINKLYADKKIKNVSILLNDSKSSMHGYSYAYR